MAENEAITYDTADHNGSLEAAEKAHALVLTIKESREYKEYIDAYNKLTPAEIEKLRSFKQIESQIQPHDSLNIEEEKRISYLYTGLILNQNIKMFIEKERAVCSMINLVFDIIDDIHLFMFE